MTTLDVVRGPWGSARRYYYNFTASYVVELATGCWLWLGNFNAQTGRPQFYWGKRNERLAYRYAYEIFRGPLEQTFDHLCANKSCVNPWHGEDVTRGENARRGNEKTHCANLHLLADPNLYYNAAGQRICRQCSLDRANARKKRMRNASS